MEDHVWNRTAQLAFVVQAILLHHDSNANCCQRKYFRGGFRNRSQAIELERRDFRRADQGR